MKQSEIVQNVDAILTLLRLGFEKGGNTSGAA